MNKIKIFTNENGANLQVQVNQWLEENNGEYQIYNIQFVGGEHFGVMIHYQEVNYKTF